MESQARAPRAKPNEERGTWNEERRESAITRRRAGSHRPAFCVPLNTDTLQRVAAALRAAVVGLGSMGANHARVLGDLPGVELDALADTDSELLARARAGRPIACFG